MNDAPRARDPFDEPRHCPRPKGQCCSASGEPHGEGHGCSTCPEGSGRPPALLWPLLLVLLLAFAAGLARLLT